MKKGIFLQGGGAKGAFQAGVIYRLYEQKYSFDIISGTSIGAINGYFVYNDDFEGLKDFWTKDIWQLPTKKMDEDPDGLVLKNDHIINLLSNVKKINNNQKKFYVNYVEIKDKRLYERHIELSELDKESKLEIIKYSALLPYNKKANESFEDILKNFDSKVVFEEFKQNIKSGIYDGYNLDGGIINNNFLNPFIKEDVDKLYLIPFYMNYNMPEYIEEKYSDGQILKLEPDFKFDSNDTLKFEKEFCIEIFNKGYNLIKEN